MLSIARGELIQIFRNRLVLVTMFLVPASVSTFFILRREVFESLGFGYIAVVVMFIVLGMGLYASAVTTLASRRQNLFLKRLKSTAASDRSILSGLLLPIAVLSLIQVAVILTVLAVVTDTPASVALLVVAVLSTTVMMLGLGLATAGLTNSPEHAQVTTLPISIGTIVIGSWVGISGTEELALLKRLLPGGAAAELVGNAWDGGVAVADSLVLLAPTLAWVVVAVALASRFFRWEPRR